MQAYADQETERANKAEAEVGRLEQEVQSRSSEGHGWQAELHQAQQDLLVAQVLVTHPAALPTPLSCLAHTSHQLRNSNLVTSDL